MDLTDNLPLNCVLAELRGTDRHAVLEELLRRLSEGGHIGDYEAALEHVMEREALETTCIGRGVAVPHARVNGLDGMVYALGRSREGIDFNSLDGSKAHLIFLLLYPPRDAARHLSMLSLISILSVRHNLVDVLMEAADAEDMIDRMRELGSEHDLHIAEGTHHPDTNGGLVNPVVALMARLQRFEQFRRAMDDDVDRTEIDRRIANVRTLVPGRYLKHFDRLMKRRGLAVVPVDQGSCTGCNMRFSSAFNQELSDAGKVFTCPTCRRFLFVT